MRTRVKSGSRAFTLTESLLIVLVLALVVIVLLPALMSPSTAARRVQCANQLKQVDVAFQVWSGDHGHRFPMQVDAAKGGTLETVSSAAVFPHFQVLANDILHWSLLTCPMDKSRVGLAVKDPTLRDNRISYFVGVDANQTKPGMLLVGDRNLTLDGTPLEHGLVMLATNRVVGWTQGIHRSCGNIAVVDGSVAQVSESGLCQLLRRSAATNRLAIP